MSWFRQRRLEVPYHPPRSLVWDGDALVDWAGGGDRWDLDGSLVDAHRSFGYGRLDAAIAEGPFALVYERRGTVGMLLRDGEPVRQVTRDLYHAEDYLYPACLFTEPGGRVLLAHCPESYCRLELEDCETGERLTAAEGREPKDYFHSRLAASPGGRRLLAAGWIWHPVEAVAWFDVAAALADPGALDALEGPSLEGGLSGEDLAATWLDDRRMVVAVYDEYGGDDEDGDTADGDAAGDDKADGDEADAGSALNLVVYDVAEKRQVRAVPLEEATGELMALGPDHVVAFFEHPRVISLKTGRTVHVFEDIDSGKLGSSIVINAKALPTRALDPKRGRFAVAGAEGIDVVEIDLGALPA